MQFNTYSGGFHQDIQMAYPELDTVPTKQPVNNKWTKQDQSITKTNNQIQVQKQTQGWDDRHYQQKAQTGFFDNNMRKDMLRLDERKQKNQGNEEPPVQNRQNVPDNIVKKKKKPAPQQKQQKVQKRMKEIPNVRQLKRNQDPIQQIQQQEIEIQKLKEKEIQQLENLLKDGNVVPVSLKNNKELQDFQERKDNKLHALKADVQKQKNIKQDLEKQLKQIRDEEVKNMNYKQFIKTEMQHPNGNNFMASINQLQNKLNDDQNQNLNDLEMECNNYQEKIQQNPYEYQPQDEFLHDDVSDFSMEEQNDKDIMSKMNEQQNVNLMLQEIKQRKTELSKEIYKNSLASKTISLLVQKHLDDITEYIIDEMLEGEANELERIGDEQEQVQNKVDQQTLIMHLRDQLEQLEGDFSLQQKNEKALRQDFTKINNKDDLNYINSLNPIIVDNKTKIELSRGIVFSIFEQKQKQNKQPLYSDKKYLQMYTYLTAEIVDELLDHIIEDIDKYHDEIADELIQEFK